MENRYQFPAEEPGPYLEKKMAGDKKKDKSVSRAVRIEDAEERKKALGVALAQIEKQFGKGSIMKMDDSSVNKDISVVSTGCLSLDIALGTGGLPRGRVIELFGPESSGKTTLTLHIVAEMQKAGGTCAFIDAEHALDPVYAERIGVDLKSLLISQPDNGEQALDICDALVRSGAVDLIIVDSVAALTPKAEIEGDMGEALPGLQARLMSQALRKLTGSINRTQCIVIFINQVRMKIGVTYGNPEVTTGGNALKFYSTIRMEIRRAGGVKKGDEIIGAETRVKVVKNKVAPPFHVAEFDIMYGTGISHESELLNLGDELDVIEKSGAWYSYQKQKIGQGKDKACEWLREHADVAREIEDKIRTIKGVNKPNPVLARSQADEDAAEEEAKPAAKKSEKPKAAVKTAGPAAGLSEETAKEVPLDDEDEFTPDDLY